MASRMGASRHRTYSVASLPSPAFLPGSAQIRRR
uniref:Uncharacterized protein n=1 Tax=Arundo donax TaxID=35708 RepID=A0A0A9H161_ARUDO